MKGKSFFSRLFGGGAEAQESPRLNAAREQIIKDAEAELAATRPVDALADALNKAEERRMLESIAKLRDNKELPKQVEKVFKQAVTAGLSSMLSRRGISIDIVDEIKISGLLWDMFMDSLLRGNSWLERADARDKSPLTEQEKVFFKKGGTK